MNHATGVAVDDADHIRQSVRDILTTPLGSRLMRRDYGSEIFALIDQPQNDVIRLQRLLRNADCMSTSAAKRERGKYGPLTRQAVATAQRKAGYGSQASGYIGIRTLRWLAKRAEGTKVETRVVR